MNQVTVKVLRPLWFLDMHIYNVDRFSKHLNKKFIDLSIFQVLLTTCNFECELIFKYKDNIYVKPLIVLKCRIFVCITYFLYVYTFQNCNNHCVCEDSWNNTYSCVIRREPSISPSQPGRRIKYCLLKDNEVNHIKIFCIILIKKQEIQLRTLQCT